MMRTLICCGVLVLGCGLVQAAEPAAAPAGVFANGNKGIGTWKVTSTGKLSASSEAKYTTESTVTTRAIVNGWYLESTGEGAVPSQNVVGAGADGIIRMWLFAPGDMITLSGKSDGKHTQLAGTDQYGSTAEYKETWLDDDHREGTFTLKANGKALIDTQMKLERVKK
jgi:hypothetical protein